MAPCSAYLSGGEVAILVLVPLEVTSIMCLVVLIITGGQVVSHMLQVVLIHSRDVFLVCLYHNAIDCERCVPLEDHRIHCCERCTLCIVWLGGWGDLL